MKYFLIVLVLISSVSFGQELNYPELNVTPRASERVKIELREEAGRAWSSHLTVQLSSLMTVVSGGMSSSSISKSKPDGDIAPTIAVGVGALWLGATTWAALKYRPYRSFYKNLKKMPYKTKRQKLTVERMAEEKINSLRSMGKKIRWFAAVSNLAASAFVIDNVDSESDAHIAASFSALLAVAPIFFNYHWENVANEQDKYKKKIFSPVAMLPIFKNPISGKSASGVSLLYTF